MLLSTNLWSERHLTRVLKNEHQAARQGNISSKLGYKLKEKDPISSAFSFQLPDMSIYKSRTTPDHGVRRGFSTGWVCGPGGGRRAIRHRAIAVRISATAVPKNTQSLRPVVKSGSVRVSE